MPAGNLFYVKYGGWALARGRGLPLLKQAGFNCLRRVRRARPACRSTRARRLLRNGPRVIVGEQDPSRILRAAQSARNKVVVSETIAFGEAHNQLARDVFARRLVSAGLAVGLLALRAKICGSC